MTIPALSVAMSVYNGATHLHLAIESVLRQTFSDFEFLILNDGSTDASRDIIDAYAAKDRRIRPIHRENRGLVASLNELVSASRAPLIARMDADDICQPERFARQIDFLDKHPDHGVIGTWTSDIDENGGLYAIKGADHPTTYQDFLDGIGSGPLLCHPSVIMRRDLVLAVGGYHAAFQHCEDFDLWLRLAGLTKMCSLPDRLVQYRHWSNQVSSKYAYIQQIGAAISYLAYCERVAGRPDPTAHLTVLPPVTSLDEVFGRDGIATAVRARVVPTLLYSEEALKHEGYNFIVDFIKEGGHAQGLWRTTARLLRIGKPARAFGLAYALAMR